MATDNIQQLGEAYAQADEVRRMAERLYNATADALDEARDHLAEAEERAEQAQAALMAAVRAKHGIAS